MKPEDYQAIYAIWISTPGVDVTRGDSKQGFELFLKRNPGFSFVAEKQKQIIGAVLSGHDGRRGFIHHLVVLPEDRRQGIGQELVRCCLEKLELADIEKCHLFIRQDNQSGLKFWESIGWKERLELTMASFTFEPR